MIFDLEKIYASLYLFCKNEDFVGYDPFDGLNSRLFCLTPLKFFGSARLVWLQMIKRSPVNIRPFALIEKGENPKGLALFALAETSRFRSTGLAQHVENVRSLLERLNHQKIDGVTENGRPFTAFGYNFDWQSRQFYAPKGTPTVVPTAFAARAYVEAYEQFGDEAYLDNACRICEFIVSCLQRPVETDDEICFSYTPTDRGVIYNASLLAGETLAAVGRLTKNNEYLDLASRSLRYVLRNQADAGYWQYGPRLRHRWVDNFHTAFNLVSIFRIMRSVAAPNEQAETALKRGMSYWLDNFFLADGTPKYFDGSTFPIDIHSAAAAIWALCELRDLDERTMPLAQRVDGWTIANMRDDAGFFYYQMRRRRLVKIPFMRWGQAWMAFALAKLIEAGGSANS